MTENRERKENEKENKEERSSIRNIYSGQCATAGSGMSIHGRAFNFILRNHFFFFVCVCVCVNYASKIMMH